MMHDDDDDDDDDDDVMWCNALCELKVSRLWCIVFRSYYGCVYVVITEITNGINQLWLCESLDGLGK